MITNRQRFCEEAIAAFGINKGDKLIMVSDFSDYKKYNGREIEVVDILGAESDLDEVALPAYMCVIDGETLQLEGHELVVTEGGTGANAFYKDFFAAKENLDRSKLHSVDAEVIKHVYRFFDSNGDFKHKEVVD